MNKLFDYLIPAAGVAVVIGLIGGYMYLTAIPAFDKEYRQVLADQQYLKDNQQKYADCYYTTKVNAEFVTPTVINRFYNEGAPKDKLSTLEAQFLAKYDDECVPILSSYEGRFKEYVINQERLARAKQTELDKLMKRELAIERQPSESTSIYEKYDPTSLQYPTSSQGKMLYTADQFADYLNQSL